MANAIVEHVVGSLLSNMVKNPNEQVYVMGLVAEDENSNNEEPITIEFDPSIKKLLEEKLNAEAPRENQTKPS